MLNRGYFITGTDTGVGKTVVSAIFCAGMGAAYWKPVQTGSEDGTDSEFLKRFAPVIFPETYRLREPLSPHAAARIEGVAISIEKIVASRPDPNRVVIVEGAGGVLVPLNERELMTDLIRILALPAIVVVRSTLGTINHTLLTLEALARRKIPVAGIVMVGPRNSQNRVALKAYGQVPVIAEVLPTNEVSIAWACREFKNFELPKERAANAGRLSCDHLR